MPEPSPSDPPADSSPPKFRFKPREFIADNPPTSTPSTFEPTDVRAHYRAATPEKRPSPAPTSAPVPVPVSAEIDIHALLRDNLAVANAAGLNETKPVARHPSRRRRDYWVTLIGFDLLIAALVLLLGPNVVSVLFGFGGIVFFNVALTWIMWVLLDDY